MKLLIFENEIVEIENAFNIFNLVYHQNSIIFEYYTNSQDFGELTKFLEYDLIMLDIDLSKSSEKDGFAILEDMKKHIPEMLNKVIVITGSSKVEKKLEEKGFDFIPILQKPIDYKDIHEVSKFFLT